MAVVAALDVVFEVVEHEQQGRCAGGVDDLGQAPQTASLLHHQVHATRPRRGQVRASSASKSSRGDTPTGEEDMSAPATVGWPPDTRCPACPPRAGVERVGYVGNEVDLLHRRQLPRQVAQPVADVQA